MSLIRDLSIALRGAYFHETETVMSLLGAMTQAPHCVPGWIAKCSTRGLEAVVYSLQSGDGLLTQRGKQPIRFDDLAQRSVRSAWSNDNGVDETARGFAAFWRLLASDFLNVELRAEYNAMKHGMRVRPGGVTVMIGIEDTPGSPAAADAMRSVGGSTFGSTFFRAEQLTPSSKPHYATMRTTINWSAQAMAHRIELIAMSITNVVSTLLIESDADPSTQPFTRPTHPLAFRLATDSDVGVQRISLDRTIVVNPSEHPDKGTLRTNLNGRGEVTP